jgi:regulatory protein spx
MIEVYCKKGCISSQKAIEWLEKNNLPFQSKFIGELTKVELVRLLVLSDKGMETFLKRGDRCSAKVSKKIIELKSLHFNDAVDYINFHFNLLKTTFIVNEDKFLAGYNKDEIRKFIPKERRKLMRDSN